MLYVVQCSKKYAIILIISNIPFHFVIIIIPYRITSHTSAVQTFIVVVVDVDRRWFDFVWCHIFGVSFLLLHQQTVEIRKQDRNFLEQNHNELESKCIDSF